MGEWPIFAVRAGLTVHFPLICHGHHYSESLSSTVRRCLGNSDQHAFSPAFTYWFMGFTKLFSLFQIHYSCSRARINDLQVRDNFVYFSSLDIKTLRKKPMGLSMKWLTNILPLARASHLSVRIFYKDGFCTITPPAVISALK
jgi:hypothetical protein